MKKISFDIVRRRYGRTAWFSWVYYRIGNADTREEIREPWHRHTPPREEIRQAIAEEIGTDNFQLTHKPRKRRR